MRIGGESMQYPRPECHGVCPCAGCMFRGNAQMCENRIDPCGLCAKIGCQPLQACKTGHDAEKMS